MGLFGAELVGELWSGMNWGLGGVELLELMDVRGWARQMDGRSWRSDVGLSAGVDVRDEDSEIGL